jgi:hypothetical protein
MQAPKLRDVSCRACRSRIISVPHEFTRRTIVLDCVPRPGGEFSLAEDARGRICVSASERSDPRGARFAVHRCGTDGAVAAGPFN